MSEASSSLVQREASWLQAAQWARWLAWASLAWMTVEGALGLLAGFQANSIALVGWALSSGGRGPCQRDRDLALHRRPNAFGNGGGPGAEGGGDQLLAARALCRDRVDP